MQKSLYVLYLEKKVEALEVILNSYADTNKDLKLMTTLALLGWTLLVITLCTQS